MKTLFAKFLSLVLIFGLSAAAHAGGHVVGNGGGVWACVDQNEAIQALWLIDFYEGQDEFKLELIPYTPGLDYQMILTSRRSWLAINLPEFTQQINASLDEVQKNIVMVDGHLMDTSDGSFRMKPSSKDCPNGKVRYLQMANFTTYGKVLIQSQLWNSDRFPSLHRAGLIFHEAIYKTLRDRFQDATSDRARRITALVFSTLPPTEMQRQIDQITTLTPDREPDPFSFASTKRYDSGSTAFSDSVVVSGFEGSIPVSIHGDGSPLLSINGGPFIASGLISSGQSLRLQTLTPKFGGNALHTVTVKAGSFTTQWNVRNHAIKVLSATYGSACGCSTNNALTTIERLCGDTAGCEFAAENVVFGECAKGCQKDLEVSYQCTTTNSPELVRTVQVREHQTARLSCSRW